MPDRLATSIIYVASNVAVQTKQKAKLLVVPYTDLWGLLVER